MPIIKVLNVQKGKIDTEKLVYFSKEDYSRDLNKFLLKPGEVCITTSGASSGKIAFNNHEQDFYLSSTVCKLQTKPEINPKYLYYSLLCFQKEIHNIVRGGAVKGLPIEQLEKLKIPLPPLEIQEQISEVLNVLQELVKELETELKLRKKQYEYYLNKLISDVIKKGLGEYKTLGEIAIDIYRGNGIKKEEIKTNQYPCIHYSEIYTNYEIWFDKCISSVEKQLIKNPKYCEHGDLLFAISSVMAKNISKSCTYLGKEKIIVGGDIVVLKHSQNAKYISYALSTNHALNQKIKYSTEGTVSHISTKAIKKLKIPLPPLEIQEQIANALDHLRELCEDLEKGIPKEIELTNKRYEYYRDLLITGEN
ncbi:putative type-1 restriction enzyme specificity protein MPN_089 [Candidatus Mycoplasma haematohominis]|uniref:Putative type-1 restriction enzyme specificity protein MPN_089 n=1 Tax=Candidatus Mycoplasma haematohominis TaxID=1494318 RepID=A0A478FQV2_9MOLU|nr:putative type-1 restriction enzyme specificity protein MPN_089 [Candidatus Mycoplasma haemohominis]